MDILDVREKETKGTMRHCEHPFALLNVSRRGETPEAFCDSIMSAVNLTENRVSNRNPTEALRTRRRNIV